MSIIRFLQRKKYFVYFCGYSRHNQIWQHITDDKGNKSKKLLVENHALMMYNPFLENKPTN